MKAPEEKSHSNQTYQTFLLSPKKKQFWVSSHTCRSEIIFLWISQQQTDICFHAKYDKANVFQILASTETKAKDRRWEEKKLKAEKFAPFAYT